MNLPKIEREDDTLWLVQDLSGLDLYERSKAIVDFCDKETKLFEKEIDRAILEIFERNGIIVQSTKKSALKLAFTHLKLKRKDIEVEDIYRNKVDLYNSELIKDTKLFSIWLEDKRYLQCGVRVKEIKL